MILDLHIEHELSRWRLKDLQNSEVRSRGIALTNARWQPGCDIPNLDRIKDIRISNNVDESILNDIVSPLRREEINIHIAQKNQETLSTTDTYSTTSELPIDRWLGVTAGLHLAGGCCVIACDNPITIDFIAPDGRYIGGYILPGLRQMKEILQLQTFNVSIDSEEQADEFVIPGRNTNTAVNHGTFTAIVSAVSRIYLELCRQENKGLALLMTGDDAAILSKGVQVTHAVWPDLVYGGLELCFPLTLSERLGQMCGAPRSIKPPLLDAIRNTLASP
ncbi:type III pantothenate kinase [Halomonas sp. HMF6819]|uniref:type III pantothenate kinase n=1 Tax=Halomonas sp. HMF6819 TaxID=3373085 RepID=UPI00379616C4